MRFSRGLCTLAAALLLTPALSADCVPSVQAVSSVGLFPNHTAGPIAGDGSILGLSKVDADPATNAIYFATYDANLQQITADTPVAAASLKGVAALLWTGTDFALFYQMPSLALTLQHLDTSGALSGGAVTLSNHVWASQDEFDVTWVAARNAFAVARTVNIGPDRGLWLTIVSPSGAVLSDQNLTVLTSPPTLPHVAALDDGTVAVGWIRPGATPLMLLSSVSPSGTVRAVPIAERAISDLRVATDGTTTLIINQASTSTGTQLRYAQVGAAGNVITPDSVYLNGSGIDIAPRSLFWNAALSEWGLVYVDAPVGLSALPGDARFRRFDSPAGLASDTLLGLSVIDSRMPAASSPVFLGGGYVVSVGRRLSHAEGSESYLVRSCPFFVTGSIDRSVGAPFVPITFTAKTSGGVPAFSYSWDFGDLSTGSGAVVHHAYNLPGVYNITLSAKDATGAQSVYKFTVQVAFLRHRAVR